MSSSRLIAGRLVRRSVHNFAVLAPYQGLVGLCRITRFRNVALIGISVGNAVEMCHDRAAASRASRAMRGAFGAPGPRVALAA